MCIRKNNNFETLDPKGIQESEKKLKNYSNRAPTAEMLNINRIALKAT